MMQVLKTAAGQGYVNKAIEELGKARDAEMPVNEETAMALNECVLALFALLVRSP